MLLFRTNGVQIAAFFSFREKFNFSGKGNNLYGYEVCGEKIEGVSMNCPYCKQDIGEKPNLKFCPICGHKLERCACCGRIFTKKIKFCPADGTPVPEEVYLILPDEKSANVSKKMKKIDSPRTGEVSSPPKGGKNGRLKEKKNGKSKILISFSILLLLCAVGVSAYFLKDYLLDGNNDKTQGARTDIHDDIDTMEQTEDHISESESEKNTETETENPSVTSESSEDEGNEKLTWEEMVKEVRELADSEGMVITSSAEIFFSSSQSELEKYDSSKDLFIYMISRDLIIKEQAEETTEGKSYICSYISSRIITSTDFKAIESSNTEVFPGNRSVAQMMINEIFAKNGYQFKDQELQRYFDNKEWYQQLKQTLTFTNDPAVVENRMNSIEKENKQFLESVR